MIVAVIILGVVLVGLWMYMRRTKPHTAVDEEARQEAILKRRMESKASRAEVDRLEQISQGKKDIEELQKPFVGAPMPNYDPNNLNREQDPEKRMKDMREAMGVYNGNLTPPGERIELTEFQKLQQRDLAMIKDNEVYDDKAYDKNTGKLTWVFDNGTWRYANKDDS